ncbi:MAG: GNAT family N-acetyltransferase [Pseudomonadota bacterium]
MNNISISILGSHEVSVLDHISPGVFDHSLRPDLIREFVSDSRHHLAVALADGKVVGFASALHYVHPDKPSEMWINEVGVAEQYQRKRIGTRLVKALFDHGASLGCGEAWVLADEDNAAARSFYRSLGGSESPAVMYSFRTD